MAPRDYALLQDDDKIEQKDFNRIKNKGDRLRNHLNISNTGEVMTNLAKKTVVEDYPITFTWRELFLKLCFE